MVPANKRLPELDILRVFAAGFVLLYHFTFREHIVDNLPSESFPAIDWLTRYGFLGVQLFFLISGFVILMSAEQRGAVSFIKSRARRLYPTFWICCTLTFAATLFWGAPIYSATWAQYWINMTMMTDFVREYSIDGAYWSIFVEIKFYLFIFLVLACKGIKKIQPIYFVWMVLTALFILLPGNNKNTTEFLLSHYMPYFAMGSILYLWWQGRLEKISYLTFAISYAIAIYNSFYEVDILNINLKNEYYSKWVYNIAITAFLVIFYLILKGKVRMGESKKLMTLGLLTYPLYLVHQHIGVMIMKELPQGMAPSFYVIIATVSVVILAYLILKSEKYLTAKVLGKAN